MVKRFLSKEDFESYEDFCENFSLFVPDTFNFAYDVVDALAAERGGDRALLWCDERGAEAEFTYGDMKRLSDRAANVLGAAGIGRGDPVMLILKRRHEYWPVLLALHKLGAVAIPATHLLTVKDIVYRCNKADIAGIICVDDAEVIRSVDEADAVIRTPLRYKAFVRSVHTTGETAVSPEW
ncbi:MAG: AMP-binding protein, partial [Treponema sp.]|nr:AMP-binding protein [Treponema sp.]